VSAADVAGLTPEQITQLMQIEIARGKERETLLGTVFNALYQREAAAKLKAERLAIPETQRIARLKEQRELMEQRRKGVKTTADIVKIDREVKELDLKIDREEMVERVINSPYGDQVITIPGVMTGTVREILRTRPELLSDVVKLLGVSKTTELGEARFAATERERLANRVLKFAGVSDLAGLEPGMRDLVMETQDRAEAFWKEGKGETPTAAATKAWREAEASFKAMKPLSKLKAVEPTIVRGVTIPGMGGNREETVKLVKDVLNTETKYTHIFKLLVNNGWTEEQAKDIMREALKGG